MKLALKALCLIGLIGFIGCGKPQATNSMENADKQALADYERMIAEDAGQASNDDAEGG